MKRRAGALMMALVLMMTSFASYAEDAVAPEGYTAQVQEVQEETPTEESAQEEPAAAGEEEPQAEEAAAQETPENTEGVTAEPEETPEAGEGENADQAAYEAPEASQAESYDSDESDEEEAETEAESETEAWDGIFTNEHPEWGGLIELQMYGVFACTITATIPENAFTCPVTLSAGAALYTPETIGETRLNAVLEAAQKSAGDLDIYDLYVLDLTFTDENGSKAEPAYPVKIEVNAAEAPVDVGAGEEDTALTIGVYHYDEEQETAQKVSEDDVYFDENRDITGMKFTSERFSPFVVLVTSDDEESLTREGTYKVSYSADLEVVEFLDAPDTVEEGEALSFSVRINDEYEFENVTANGTVLAAEISEDEDGRSVYTYTYAGEDGNGVAEDVAVYLDTDTVQVIDGYGTINVTDQQTNAFYTVNINDVPTNTNISLSSKNIVITDETGETLSGISLSGKLYYVPTGSETETEMENWSPVFYFVLDGNKPIKEDDEGDGIQYFDVVPYGEDGAFDMKTGSLYLRNATVVSARADIMPIQAEYLCEQGGYGDENESEQGGYGDENENTGPGYTQTFIGAKEMTGNPQVFYYPGYEDDVIEMSVLTNDKAEEFYWGSIGSDGGIGDLYAFEYAKIVNIGENTEGAEVYYLYPSDEDGNVPDGYDHDTSRLYMKYDEIYSFDVILNSIVNEDTEDNGDVYLWKGTTYYVDQYHNMGGTSNGYTNYAPSVSNNWDSGAWDQLALGKANGSYEKGEASFAGNGREYAINNGKASFSDYSNVSPSDAGDVIRQSGTNKISTSSSRKYGIAGPYTVAEGATDVTTSKVRITGHIGDKFTPMEAFGEARVYLVTDENSQLHSDWIDIGAHPSDGGTRSWWYWINDYYLLNNYTDELEFIEIAERVVDETTGEMQVRLEADEVGEGESGLEEYDIWDAKLFIKRESVIKTAMLNNKTDYTSYNISFQANAGRPHHIQLRMNGNFETVIDGITYSGELSVLSDEDANGNVNTGEDSKAPYVEYTVPYTDSDGNIKSLTESAYLGIDNEQESKIHYFGGVSGSSYYVPNDLIYDTDYVQIHARINFTGTITSTNGDKYEYTKDNPFVYENDLTENELREAYDSCPNKAGYDLAVNLADALINEVDIEPETVLYKIWDDDDNARDSRGNVDEVEVNLERSKDGETWETVLNDMNDPNSGAKEFSIPAPTDEDGNVDCSASQWSLVLSEDDLDLSYTTDDGDTAFYEFRISKEELKEGEKTAAGFTYNTTIVGTTVTNTLVHDTETIEGEKLWVGDNGEELKDIPVDSVIITLYQDGHYYERATVSAENGWKFEFTDLPIWHETAKYEYTIGEMTSDGTAVGDGDEVLLGNEWFKVGIEENEDGSWSITNTLQTGSLTVSKHVVESTPASHLNVTFTVVITAETKGVDFECVSVTDSTGGTVSFTTDKDAGTITFGITNGQAVTVSGLPVGSYTVEETRRVNDDFRPVYRMGEEEVEEAPTVYIEADAKETETVAVEIDNEYPITTSVQVRKNYASEYYPTGEDAFSFTIEALSCDLEAEDLTLTADDMPMPEEPTIAVTNGDAVSFGNMEFTHLGTYYYKITETQGSLQYVSYDSSVYYVKIVVSFDEESDKGYYELTAAESYAKTYERNDYENLNYTSADGIITLEFVNGYSAQGRLNLTATKNYARATLTEEQFTFKITETTDGATYTKTGTNDSYGNITFPEITYSLSDVGTHTYEISEIDDSAGGVTYDSNKITVTVEVADAGDGTLTTTVTVNDSEIEATDGSYNVGMFINSYNSTGGVTLKATKEYTGAKLTAGLFSFTITETTQGATYTSTGTNDADGNITFAQAISYTLDDVGTHTYAIEETNSGAGGVTYDSDRITVTVVVEDNGNGTLSTFVSVNGEGVTAGSDGAYNVGTFSNKYEATGSLKLSATKKYTGAELTDDLFNFTITETTDPEAENPYTETVTNEADGSVTFSEIKYHFSDVGTHIYKISETAGNAGGVTYDSDTITVTVVVADYGDGTLSTTVTVVDKEITAGTDGFYNVGTFENSYKAIGSVTFGGEKKINGKDEEISQQFTFELYTTDNDFIVAEGVTATDTQTVTGAGSFKFKSISYDSDEQGNGVGTYYYVVKETATNENGWTSDTKEYHITVVVTDAGNGTFALNVTCVDAGGQAVTLEGTDANGVYNFTGLDFTNEYKPAPTSVQFTGSKYLTNSASDSESTNKKFTFELYNADSSFASVGDAIDTKTITGAGSIVFDEIEYKETGTYYYLIQEKALDEAEGWTIDPTVYNITVEVTDDGLGQLVATVTEVTKGTVTGAENVYGGFDFTNAYAAEGNVTLGVVKSISGVAYTDETFEFTLYESDENFVIGDSIATIMNNEPITDSAQLNFTAIPYTKAGTYYYVITETGTAPAGWTLDTKEYQVTVTVTDNGDGTLKTSASYAYTDEEDEEQTGNAAVFTNTYAASGSLSLAGTKTFTGGELEEDAFTFTMTDSTGESVGDVMMDENGSITFPTLTYDETDIGGEYTYTITEVNANDSGVVYDDKTYTVVVSVTDNKDGTLNVTYTVNDEENRSIAFTNYQLGSLTITKAFTGLTEEQIESLTGFTITVTNSYGVTVATLTLENEVKGSFYTWTVSDLPADTYTITETGYSLDGYEVIVQSGEVSVTDGSDVSVDDALAWGGKDTVSFTNDYTEVGSLSISKHVVEGTQASHLDVGYTVVITAASDDAVDFQWVTVTDSEGKEISCETDTETKTITFTIKNGQTLTVSGLPAGSYTVEETTADNTDSFAPVYCVGGLEKEIAPTVDVSSGEENIITVEIDNEYPIGTYIQIKKNYNNTIYPEGDNAFTFTIVPLSFEPEAEGGTLDPENMPMPSNSSVTITDDNAVSFGQMEFEHLGTYYYMITETEGKLDYIVYDTSVYYVKVVVSFDETATEEYYLETAEESYCKVDEETKDYKDLDYISTDYEDPIVTAEFENTYSAEGSLTLTATKNYTGAELTEGLFNFTITETTEGVEEENLYSGTGTNDADGTIEFTPEIEYTFDNVGEHIYEISETAGKAGGVTYDSDTITVTVLVADHGTGVLTTTVTVDGKKITVADNGYYNVGTFKNHYQATGSVTFGGEKTISGKDKETNQQFTFALYKTDSDFTVAEGTEATDTQTVTGAGSFTFKTISYDSDTRNGAGTYYYVVKETSTDGNGWTMDETEYHITVVVNDACDGTFTLAVSCVDAKGETVTLTKAEDGSYSFTGLAFSNTYKAAETSVQFTGTKYITNSASDDATDKEFKFELYDANSSFETSGDAVQTKTTTGAGSITFDKITYNTTGTYYYVIKEVQEESAGWTMDPKVYSITVVVTDDGIGQLHAAVTVNGTSDAGTDKVYGGFDFTNAYAAEGEVTLGVVKSISGVASTDETFSFTLYDSDKDFTTGDEIETISNDDNITNSTQLNFTAIPYTKAGTYYYVITETGTATDGWALDEKEYHVTVTVTNNGDGTLTTSVSYAYTDEKGETQTGNVAAFTNTYAATGELALTGTKTFTGGVLEEKSFTFTMTDSTGESVGDVTMDDKGNIAFPTLTYDETDIGGEYTYTITEVKANDSSVTYDETRYTVVVDVADNMDGTLDVTYTVNGTDSGDITFTNYQKGSLTITKDFTGLTEEQIADLTNFTITVTDSIGHSVAVRTLNDANEGSTYTWTVSDLPADTYTVTESGYSLNGYEVIAKSGEVELKTDGTDASVEDMMDWGGEDKVDFTNDYTEVGSLKVTKYVIAEAGIQKDHEDTEYTVVITAADKDADFRWVTVTGSDNREINPTIKDDTITFTITEDETVTVTGLPSGQYTVKETGSDAATSESFVPVYRVGDEGSGEAPTVTVKSGTDNIVAVEIDNEYPIATYIQVRKDYNRDPYPDEGFTFVIEALSCDLALEGATMSADEMPMPTSPEITITKDGEIGDFGIITYKYLGTYYYKITETAGSNKGITYDKSVHYIKVMVSYDEDSHVESVVEYENIADAETGDYKDLDYRKADGIITAEFKNTYSAEGSLSLAATKQYTGTDLTEGLFSFTITETTDPEAENPYTETVTNDAEGNITFTSIEYKYDSDPALTDVGEHTYEISEVPGDAGGVTYDEKTLTVTVNVIDYGNGTLVPAVTIGGSGLTSRNGVYNVGTFENTYEAEGSLALTAAKEYTGAALKKGLFAFTITETTDPEAEDPYSETATNAADGSITFPTISYVLSDAGTHTYEIAETKGTDGGVAYDGSKIALKVEVTDNGDGTLSTAVRVNGKEITAGEDGSYSVGTFKNHYEAVGSVTFGGTKKLKGRDHTYQTFTFALYTTDDTFEIAEGAIPTDVQNVTGAGTFVFKEISYDSDVEGNGTGIYYYAVKETSEDENGWTMDETEYHITVTVTDAGDGTFTIEVSCVDAEGEAVTLIQAEDGSYNFTGLDFINEYEAAPTSVRFTGKKYISNSLSTEKVFTFELYTTDETFSTEGLTPRQKSTSGEITNSGQEFLFDEIRYTKPGTYYYVMKEQALDEAEGWTIDGMVYNITVEVKDDGLGQLIAEVTVYGVSVAGTYGVYGGFDFDNGYAASGEVILGVVKSVEGVAGTDKTFSFTLYDSDEEFAIGDKIETINTYDTIPNSEELNFTPISYEHDSSITYPMYDYYVIKETGTAPDGWALDDKEYHVTVTVEDDGTGTLTTASYIYTDKNGEPHEVNDAHFVNIYTASGSLSLTGTKTLTGGTLTEDAFAFTMEDSAGTSLGETSMGSDGTITFPTLTYDETDIGKEYTYFITEANTGDSSFIYDDHVYKVEVSVADNKDGTLDITYTVDGEENGDITFTNYQKGSLTITKTFTGLTEDQIESLTDFTVTVKDSSGETVATLKLEDAQQNKDGSYSWTVRDLAEDTYTVTETGYGLAGYEVIAKSGTVEVTDGSDVTVEDKLAWGGEDTIAFANEYTEVGTLSVKKYVIAEEEVQAAQKGTEYTVVLTADADADYRWVQVTSDNGRKIEPEISGRMITFTITEDETVTVTGLPAGSYTVEETGPDTENSESFVPVYHVGDTESEEAPAVTVKSGTVNEVAVEIDNEYPINTDILVQKIYNKDSYPEEGFTFTIEACSFDPEAEGISISEEEMPLPDETSVTLTENGETASFGSITYKHLGTYYYKITETAGSGENILYDTSVHYIKVVVASETGTHVETVGEWESVAPAETADYKNLDYTKAEDGVITAVFTNTYLEELTIEKEVAGNSDSEEYVFEITLTNPDGTPYEGEVSVNSGKEEEGGLSAWFSGVLRAFASDSTVAFVNGSAQVTIKADGKITLMIPSGVSCTVAEKTTGADTTTVYDGDGNVIGQAKGKETQASAKVGIIADSTQVKFVNSYRGYFPIDEEIVPDYTDRDTWVKDEAVNEYNAIEIEMSTFLPVITGYDLENGEFTMNFHEVLDHELVLDEADADFMVFIGGVQVDHKYYTITTPSTEASPAAIRPFSAEDENTLSDGCTFHVDVNLTALYNDGVISEEDLQGDTEIIIFFFADLEGTGLNGSYKSTVWYDIYDGDEWLYTSEEDVVYVYTYEIDILKYDASTLEGKNYEGSALAGATLGVYNDKACTDPVSRNGEAYTAASDEEGRAVFYGLADGTYYVKETEAPDGYVLSGEVLTVILGSGLENNAYEGVYANTPEPETETETETEIPGTEPKRPGTEAETESEIPQTEPDTTPRDPVKSVDAGSGKTVSVGQELIYTVTYYNYNTEPAAVTVTDRLDTGLEFVSASDGGVYDEQTRTISWTIESAAPVTEGCVTFKAKVLESALETGSVENVATVRIGNDDAVSTNLVSNPTSESVKTGDNTPLGPAAGLMALSLALLAETVAYRRKRKAI